MSKSYITKIILCISFGVGLNTAWSQQAIVTEEIFSLGMQLGSGARAISMGGAFTSVGNDFSSSLWNPATLRNIDAIEFYGSLSHLNRENNFRLTSKNRFFDPTASNHKESYTKLNDFGLAYAVPTTQGALALGFGFNRVKSFDSNFNFSAFDAVPIADSDDPQGIYPDSVKHAWQEFTTGSLNIWNISGALDVSPNVSVGISLNFWSGGTNFESTFDEFDDVNIYLFDSYTIENSLTTDISGFNAKVGTLFRMGILNLGGAISTPISLKIDESFFEDVSQYDDNGLLNEDFSYSSDAIFDYKIQSPWSFSAGASLNLLNFIFAADIEHNDWSNVRYNSLPPFEGVSTTEANRNIRNYYRPTQRIRLGAEFKLPFSNISLRAGYFEDPSIFKNADPDENKKFYSAGIGLQVDKKARLDLAYVHGKWKYNNQGLPNTITVGSYEENIKINKFYIALALQI